MKLGSHFDTLKVVAIVGGMTGLAGIAIAVTAMRPLCVQNGESMAACAGWAQALGTIAAVFAAVGIGWLQVRQSRREHLMLTKPRLTFDRIVQQDKPNLELIVMSVGLGPAIVLDYVVLLDGVVREVGDNGLFWTDLMRELRLPDGVRCGGTVLGAGQILASGTTRTLMRYEARDEPPPNGNLHREADRLTITIRYRSMHGEVGVASTDASVSKDIDI